MNCHLRFLVPLALLLSIQCLGEDTVLYQAPANAKFIDEPYVGSVAAPFGCDDAESGIVAYAQWALESDLKSSRLFIQWQAAKEKGNPILKWLQRNYNSGAISQAQLLQQFDLLTDAQKRVASCILLFAPKKVQGRLAAFVFAMESFATMNNNYYLETRGLIPVSQKIYQRGRLSLGVIPVLKEKKHFRIFGGSISVLF